MLLDLGGADFERVEVIIINIRILEEGNQIIKIVWKEAMWTRN